MKNLVNFFKVKLNKLMAIGLLSAVISLGILPITQASADAPLFNFLNGDQELLTGKREGSQVFTDPVNGIAGDIFTGKIYYHNGTEVDTFARNTKIKVNIPSQTQTNASGENYFVINAAISADNMSGIVTDTTVNGSIVGQSGLTTILDSESSVEFIPGSVKWYPENSGLSSTPAVFPLGQTGDEIIAQGLNIGDIQSCWNHSGLLTFSYKTVKKAGLLTLDKQVKNLTLGQNSWSKTTEAKQNETIAFKISLSNTGGTTENNVSLKDLMPGDLEYINNTLEVSVDQGNFIKISDPIEISRFFTSGITIAKLGKDLAEGNNSYVFQFSAKALTVTNDHSVINKAEINYAEKNQFSIATVDLKKSLPANIIKSKTAFNITKNVGGVNFSANASDIISYTLTTKNDGQSEAEVVIEDGIADVLDYADVITGGISNDGKLVDGSVGNDEKLIRYPAVIINPGESVVRTFKVQVKNIIPNTPANGFRFDHIMYNKYGNEVTITIPKPEPGKPVLKTDKKVRNFSASESIFSDENLAKSGDTLEYIISFENSGSGPANYLKVTDVLPANTQFLSGTTIYSINNESERTLTDGIVTSQGVSFNTLQPGDKGYIKFKVITAANLAEGENLVNTGYVSSGNITVSDTAKTVIKKSQTPVNPSEPEAKKPIQNLPKTGISSYLLTLLLTFTFLSGLYYMKSKKELASLF